MKIINESAIGKIRNLKAGDTVSFSGIIYTARDQAHRRLKDIIDRDGTTPFDLKGKIIYYCGPTQTPKGKIIGSCGPTTSSRMDDFIKPLLKKGLLGMIGKGRRKEEAKNLIRKYKAVYFLAPSGCGALLSKKVLYKKLVAFSDLGSEAVYKLKIKDFPLIVGIDSKGKDIYST